MKEKIIEFADLKLNEDNAYRFLGRLFHDAEQFIMEGSWCYGKENRLFSGSVKEHIKDMRKLWLFVYVKPQWLSWEVINKFEKQMIEIRKLSQDIKFERMYS
jgi:hypothetical protein